MDFWTINEENRVQWLFVEFHFHRYLMVVLAFKHWAKYQATESHVFH